MARFRVYTRTQRESQRQDCELYWKHIDTVEAKSCEEACRKVMTQLGHGSTLGAGHEKGRLFLYDSTFSDFSARKELANESKATESSLHVPKYLKAA